MSMAIAAAAVFLAAITAMLARPWRTPEWLWPCAGAAVMIAGGLLLPQRAVSAAADGRDVYLFLAGMIGLAELARTSGIFESAAGALARSPLAATPARGFTAVYAAGVVVTAFLSNDGTIVLLTPAALAFARRTANDPIPLLFACALVANAASFIFPFSNPANLVIFRQLPSLRSWLTLFALPSAAAIAATYAAMRAVFSSSLRTQPAPHDERAAPPESNAAARAAAWAIAISVLALVLAAVFGYPLGRVAFAAAAVSGIAVAAVDPARAVRALREGPWTIIPLVAGLFVMTAGLDQTGVLAYARTFFSFCSRLSPIAGNLTAGTAAALIGNALNNLPVATMARYALPPAAHVAAATAVGVDVGPNLTLAGSLATLLWLMSLRREGIAVTPGAFLRVGIPVALPALLLALLLTR
jgi:arsenical pump membrane protein